MYDAFATNVDVEVYEIGSTRLLNESSAWAELNQKKRADFGLSLETNIIGIGQVVAGTLWADALPALAESKSGGEAELA